VETTARDGTILLREMCLAP